MRVRHRSIQLGSRHRSPNQDTEFLECRRGKNGSREAYRGSDSPRPRMTGPPCCRMNRVSGVEAHEVDRVGPAPKRDIPRLAWGVIGGIAPGWTSATSGRMVMVGLCRGWFFSSSTNRNLSRMGLGFRNKSCREFYGQWCLMKFALNNFWTPRSTGKSQQLDGSDPQLIPPGVHRRLATQVMDPGTFGDVQGMSVAPQWDGSGTTDAFPWGAWPRDAAVTRTSKQAGKALRSQGHQYDGVM